MDCFWNIYIIENGVSIFGAKDSGTCEPAPLRTKHRAGEKQTNERAGTEKGLEPKQRHSA